MVCANLPHSSQAVHDRHAQIHQYEIGAVFESTFHRLFAVCRYEDRVSLDLQKELQYIPCVCKVVGYENYHEQQKQLEVP